jgi:hypothetical protein
LSRGRARTPAAPPPRTPRRGKARLRPPSATIPPLTAALEGYLRRAHRVLPRVRRRAWAGNTLFGLGPHDEEVGTAKPQNRWQELGTPTCFPSIGHPVPALCKGDEWERERRSRTPDKPPSPSSQPARVPEVKLFCASRAENGPKYAVRLAASAHPDVEMACESVQGVISFRTAWAALLSPQLQKSLKRRGGVVLVVVVCVGKDGLPLL